MSALINGGPAFPVDTGSAGDTESGEFGHQTGNTTWQFSGMTLRDYAAIHADAPWAVVFEQLYRGLGNKNPTFDQVAEGMATLRYKMADAMLAERAKVQP